jgi:hypothetical protein
LLLIGLLGLLTSAASRAFSDTITFGINLAVMTNLVQFANNVTLEKRANVTPTWRKWGPFAIIAVASVASMLDITRSIVVDSNTHSLVKPGGAKGAFNFDDCSYTATAAPLSAMSSASCPATPMTVVQTGAVPQEVNTWLQSKMADNICWAAGWATFWLTIVGFAWLSETVAWFRFKLEQVQKEGLREALLSTEDPTSCSGGSSSGAA